jgi:hypothetical protein
MKIVVTFAVLASMVACSPDPIRRAPPTSTQLGEEMKGDPQTPPPPPSADTGDAPEISRSVGVQGGVVILWPRVAKSGDQASIDFAARIQSKLRTLVEKAVPGAPIDVRPEPERVCPKPKGCTAATVSAIVTRKGEACAVVALVSGAGASPQRLVPWAGATKMDALTVAFREPPEPHVKVSDYASCAKIDEELNAHEADVIAAIRAAVPR